MRTLPAIGVGIAAAVVVFVLQQARMRVAVDKAADTRSLRSPVGVESPAAPGIGGPVPVAERTGEDIERHAAQSVASAAAESPFKSASGGNPNEGDALLLASETYRNTSLLTAIRDAGFLCFEMLAVESAAEGVKSWRVSCEAMTYFVADDGSGRFEVELLPAVDRPQRPLLEPGFEDRVFRILPAEEFQPRR